MPELTLNWQEKQQNISQKIFHQQYSKHPGTVRLGRDPAQCDLVFSDLTVSGLHVEIFFDAAKHAFVLRNLRDSNPPLVDGRAITYEEPTLHQGSTIYLGEVKLRVSEVNLGEPEQQNLSKQVSYGLQCPNCGRYSSYDRLALGCQWCGTSLASAISVVIPPESSEG
ncbi:MAG: FHA domain-containing protein [Symploca sp. SIO2E6]|nr:FHA domain-containing protein [Symploca sp. SIO2E6]